MRLRTLLVGTDLAESSDPAILRGHQLALRHDARLVVCHVTPPHLGNHSLFPQRYEQEAVAATTWDERLAEAVSRRVVELTDRSPETFEVIIDQGPVARALIDQAARVRADLVVVTGDTPKSVSEPPFATITRDLARSSVCPILVEKRSAGSGIAVMALAGELETIPRVIEAATLVAARPPSKIAVILWVTEGEANTRAWSSRMAAFSQTTGVPVEPWFAAIGDTSVITRASTDPSIALVALSAPPPDHGLVETTSPFEDALPMATNSILLLRDLPG